MAIPATTACNVWEPTGRPSAKKILETIPDVTVLADHTKFGRKALVAVFSIAFAQCVVTNKAIPAEYLDWLTKSGVRTVIADNATKEEG